MRFSKWQGAGNDFIIVDEFEKEVVRSKKVFAVKACARRFGVGADGVLFLSRSKKADACMRIFNPDGSEPEMCGNGIRCAAKYLFSKGVVRKKRMKIETLAGIIEPEITRSGVRVFMGKPLVIALRDWVLVEGRQVDFSSVSMGNPHAVVFSASLSEKQLRELGPVVSTHPKFPKGTNVHFVQVLSKKRVRVLHWERGAGATLACGTGACAVAVASRLLEKTGDTIDVQVPGGVLGVQVVLKKGVPAEVFLSGPAEEVFEGTFEA